MSQFLAQLTDLAQIQNTVNQLKHCIYAHALREILRLGMVSRSNILISLPHAMFASDLRPHAIFNVVHSLQLINERLPFLPLEHTLCPRYTWSEYSIIIYCTPLVKIIFHTCVTSADPRTCLAGLS